MKNGIFKITILSLLSVSFITAASPEFTLCKDTYIKLNKHNKRASIFINASDWDMAKFYIEKIKDDYNTFYTYDCFSKIFDPRTIDHMRKKYAGNVQTIKNISEMIDETIDEKERQERRKLLKELEEKKRIEKEKLRAEILEEMKGEETGDYPVVEDDDYDIINNKEEFMREYLKSKGGKVRIINSKK